ncbi:MAG: carboxypeptidase-like regulatory domain-containing protein [Bacteroidota bacterium]
MRNWLLAFLAVPLLFLGCRKDVDNITTNSEYQPPVVVVTGKLVGQVVDETGNAVPNSLVRVGNRSAVSNEFGLFNFDNIQMNASGTYITASRDGYFLGSDRIYPANGSSNFSRIQLLAKTLAGTFNSVEGGTIEVSGASVRFDPSTIANQQGSLVNGEVSVYAQWLDPSAENLGDFMPGALFGLNEAGQEVTMTSMGMLAVELFDADGNELNIAAGREATVQFPVPASLLSIAPTEIPLWHFDETDGVWIEEGSATLDGSTYTGKVNHFTFWNVDFPYGTETVDVSGCVKFEDGSPATFYDFRVSVEGGGIIVWGRTDGDGNFYGPVPVNETLIFTFQDPGCGPAQTFTVGPLTEDTDLEGCFILVETQETITFSGQLVDCDGEPVGGGVVLLQHFWPWQVITADEEGFFSATFDGCDGQESFTITAYDFENQQATEPMQYSIAEDQDIGQLPVCDVELDEILSSNADGYELDFFDLELGLDSIVISPDSIEFFNYSEISGRGFDGEGNQSTISILIRSTDVGSYTGDDVGFSYWFSAVAQGSSFNLNCWIPCNTITVNVTNNEGPGGFLEGNYSGTSDGWDAMQMPLQDRPVSGTFRVRIPQ